MLNKRRVRAGLVIGMVVLCLAGCGSKKETEKQTEKETETTSAPAVIVETADTEELESASEIITSAEHSEKAALADKTYTSVPADTAYQMLSGPGDFVIVDVRTAEEFASGHVPNAINIPSDMIGKTEIKGISSETIPVFVYADSSTGSKAAAEKLTGLGYTNVIEFGSFEKWQHETE